MRIKIVGHGQNLRAIHEAGDDVAGELELHVVPLVARDVGGGAGGH